MPEADPILQRDKSLAVVVDVQGKLAQVMHGRDELFDNLSRFVRGMKLLNIPIISVEQTPEKLGPTIEPLRELLRNQEPVTKKTFSCWGEPEFVKAVGDSGRGRIIVAGIETHVCVQQTALEMKAEGFHVEVAADATSSRSARNRDIALDKMARAGVTVTSVETALFELLRTSETAEFREMLKIVK